MAFQSCTNLCRFPEARALRFIGVRIWLCPSKSNPLLGQSQILYPQRQLQNSWQSLPFPLAEASGYDSLRHVAGVLKLPPQIKRLLELALPLKTNLQHYPASIPLSSKSLSLVASLKAPEARRLWYWALPSSPNFRVMFSNATLETVTDLSPSV